MLLDEFDAEKYERTIRSEGREEGYAEGEAKGRAEGREEGFAEGEVKGRAKGRMEGRADKLREQIQRKRAKNKPIPVIAEELEEDISVIEEIVAEL